MLKYVNTGVVFQEIPDEVTLSINISNCPCRCPGCHSQYLWQDIGDALTPEVIDGFMDKYCGEVTCICFMGGDAEPKSVCELAMYVRDKYHGISVAWYSGRQEIPGTIDKNLFSYIKTGPYIEKYGGLDKQTTNQRMYKKVSDNEFIDITHVFWKK